MLPAEPSRSVVKCQIIQLLCAGWARLNNEAIPLPWRLHHHRVCGEVSVFLNVANFHGPVDKDLLKGTVPVNKELLTGTVPKFYAVENVSIGSSVDLLLPSNKTTQVIVTLSYVGQYEAERLNLY